MPNFELGFKDCFNYRTSGKVSVGGVIERIIVTDTEETAELIGKLMEGEECGIYNDPHDVWIKSHIYLGKLYFVQGTPIAPSLERHHIDPEHTWKRILKKLDLSEDEVDFVITNGAKVGLTFKREDAALFYMTTLGFRTFNNRFISTLNNI